MSQISLPAKHQRIFTGAPWESEVGYCRAVIAGAHIYISGTTAVGAHGELVGIGDGYAQAKRCLDIISETLSKAGASTSDVVRTRMFVTDITRWKEYAKAHAEYFSASPPATTMVEVSKLIDPEMLIEIEADAVLQKVQT